MQLIIYIDINSFFVSCHQAKNTNLKNKNVIVASDSRRAVVVSASYPARKLGIKAGMPLYQTKNICPNAIYVKPDRNLYLSYSHKILNYLKNNFTNLVERCSIDEYCLDITNIYHKYGSPTQCAQVIQAQLLTILDLPCSIGISFTKQLAKIASKLKKPQGIAIIMPEDLATVLFPLTIENLNGIGPKTATKLKTFNINTINDLVNHQDELTLNAVFGKRYKVWIDQALGKTTAKVNFNHKTIEKSIGRDYTLEYDSNNLAYLTTILKNLVEQVMNKVNKKSFMGKTIVCGFKFDRSHWTTKQMTIATPIDKIVMYQTVLLLFNKIWKFPQNVRALRVALKNIG